MSTHLLQYHSKLTVATFNVRGLTAKTKREALERDLSRYHVDVCAIHKTKITDHVSEVLPNGYHLITFPQSNGHQRGISFLTSLRMRPFLSKYCALTDCMATVYCQLPCGKYRKDTNRIRIIIANGPTLNTYTENPKIREEFYDAITSLWQETSEWQITILHRRRLQQQGGYAVIINARGVH